MNISKNYNINYIKKDKTKCDHKKISKITIYKEDC